MKLRRSLGVVLQHVPLFSGNVMKSIRYGPPPDVTDAACFAEKETYYYPLNTGAFEPR